VPLDGDLSGDASDRDDDGANEMEGQANESEWRRGSEELYEVPLLSEKRVLLIHDEDPVGIDDTVLEHLFAHDARVRTVGESRLGAIELPEFDLAVVSSAKDFEAASRFYAGAQGPVLILQPHASEALGFGERVWSAESNSAQVAETDHPIAKGMRESLVVCDRVTSVAVNLVPDGVSSVLSAPGNSREALLFAAEAGTRIDGAILEYRRAGTGLLREESCMTHATWSLLDSTLTWLLEPPE